MAIQAKRQGTSRNIEGEFHISIIFYSKLSLGV